MRTNGQEEIINRFFDKLYEIYEKRLSNIEKLAKNNEKMMKEVKLKINDLNRTFSEVFSFYKNPPSEEKVLNSDFKSFFDKIIKNSQLSNRKSPEKRSFSNENKEKTRFFKSKKPEETKGFKVMMKSNKSPNNPLKKDLKSLNKIKGNKSILADKLENNEENPRTQLPEKTQYTGLYI